MLLSHIDALNTQTDILSARIETRLSGQSGYTPKFVPATFRRGEDQRAAASCS